MTNVPADLDVVVTDEARDGDYPRPMPQAFKRLRLLRRRPSEPEDQAPADDPAVDIDEMPLVGATLGSSPILRPAAIFHQLLFDPAESSPVWARPRLAPAPDPASSAGPIVSETAVADPASTDVAKPTKRTRRPKANASASASRTRTKRIAKPPQDATDG
jgi:hypothetical protein